MHSKGNVLVVDDDPNWCAIYEEALSEKGYMVRKALDLETALRRLNQLFFHVAIVDIRLDASDRDNVQGLEVLQRIWSLDEGTVAVVLSGHATPDMMTSFMNYGVFDFVLKSEMNPSEISRQYKSAAFIKATIDKTGSLAESLDRIEKAANEAQHIAQKRKRQESPFRLFRGLSSRDIQMRLKGSGMIELRNFVGRLCWALHPWLVSKRDAVLIEENPNGVETTTWAVEAISWSRTLGKPVVVRFGRKDYFQRSVSNLPIGSSYGYSGNISEKILSASSDHFQGEVWTLTDIAFDAEFAPPSLKRMSRSNIMH